MNDHVRIGILGAARIAPSAVVRPARNVSNAVVISVAARDRARARRFAEKHGLPRIHDGYAELIDDAEIDAVYNPLPNGLHAQWTIAALEACKHVLCEKPFTANAPEAEAVAKVADSSGKVVMEAFHWRYHPLAQRMVEIVTSGEIGCVEQIDGALCFPLPRFSDIRYQYDLAGGALMDAGCYPVHMVRTLGGTTGEEPTVVSATAKLRDPRIDRAMHAELRWPSGHTGTITCSMWSKQLLRMHVRVKGEAGELRVFNPTAPQMYHRLKVTAGGSSRVEHLSRRPTYEYQLEAFCAAVQDGAPTLTPPSESIANMRVIDDIYRAAGLTPR
jgi:predicted dehydrogenase